jgi:hypothetical protein
MFQYKNFSIRNASFVSDYRWGESNWVVYFGNEHSALAMVVARMDAFTVLQYVCSYLYI